MEMIPPSDAIKDQFAVFESQKRNRIQVSNKNKPIFYYVNLAKRFMQRYDEIELSALGMAIGTVVTVSEILKNNGLATQNKIVTSTVGMKDESNGRLIRKAKIEISLTKTQKLDEMMAAAKMDRGYNGNAAKARTAENFGEEVKDE